MNLFDDDVYEQSPTQDGGAVFSACHRYRYLLYRRWKSNGGGTISFVGLNPSTADAMKDDATIRRCVGFAKRWGYNRLFMLNLFAFRATKPCDMKRQRDPIGPHNRAYMKRYTGRAKMAVCCWGVNADGFDGVLDDVWLAIKQPMYCSGVTRSGHPKHPGRLPNAATLRPFTRP